MNRIAVAEELVKLAKSLVAGKNPFSFFVDVATMNPERAFSIAKKMPNAKNSIAQCSSFSVRNNERMVTIEQAETRADREYPSMRDNECRALAVEDVKGGVPAGWYFYGMV